jgi:phenol hydroxylase P1 protein
VAYFIGFTATVPFAVLPSSPVRSAHLKPHHVTARRQHTYCSTDHDNDRTPETLLSYELRQQVIEPRRSTFTPLITRYGGRPATRYEEASIGIQATENFHYRPLWDPAHEIYDETYSALRLTDPDGFTDPRQYYYATYVANRASLHESFGRTLTYVGDRGLLTDMPQPWQDLLTRLVLPLRYYESGAQLISVTGARYAYGTALAQCLAYAGFDRIANAQLISRIGIAVGGNTDAALAGTKTAWQDDAALQGLRRLVEELLVESDWAVATLVLDLSDRLILPLLTRHLDKAALLGGAGAYSLLTQYLGTWFADQRKWLDALLLAWCGDPGHGRGNAAVLQAAVTRYLPQLRAAVGDLAREADTIVGTGAALFVAATADELTGTLRGAGYGPEEA